jgi:uncharacterized protein YkwD
VWPVDALIIAYTNQARQAFRLPPLQVNSQLTLAASHHAGNMAWFGRMSHELPGAVLPAPQDRVRYFGFDPDRLWWAENVAFGYPDAYTTVAAWMQSHGHRVNILNPRFTDIGVGIQYDRHGVPYYCQMFAGGMEPPLFPPTVHRPM